MNELIPFNTDDVLSKIHNVRGYNVILDKDVANIYGVETKRVNEAVRNNQEKFPNSYIIELTKEETDSLRSKFSTLENGRGRHSKYAAHAFTEKGLYMLATVLKSSKATSATFSIIESFAKLREVARNITAIHNEVDKDKQKGLVQRTGELISELIFDDGDTIETESTIELNLMALKLKHTVKRTKGKQGNE